MGSTWADFGGEIDRISGLVVFVVIVDLELIDRVVGSLSMWVVFHVQSELIRPSQSE